MTMKNILPVMLCISQLFLGCQKDSVTPLGTIGDPSEASVLLTKVTHDADTLYDTYEYNDNHEVIKITTHSIHNSEPLRHNLYFYDQDSKLVRRELYRQQVDHQLAAYETLTWEADEVTKLIYVLYYNENNQKIAEELFRKNVYTLNGRLETTRLSEFQNIPGLGLFNFSYTDYKWENGNIIEKKTWNLSDDGSQFFPQPTVTLRYDDQRNPYRVLPHEALNRPWLNNVIEETDAEDNYVTTYTYAYHASGYIQSALKKTIHMDDDNEVEEERFTYEYTPVD